MDFDSKKVRMRRKVVSRKLSEGPYIQIPPKARTGFSVPHPHVLGLHSPLRTSHMSISGEYEEGD